MLMVTVFSRCSALFCKAKTVCKYALIICCGLVIAGCGGGSSAVDEPEENTSGTVPPVVEEPVEEPEVITVPYDMPRDGRIEGVHIWQLPDSPEGDRPDQCWLAVGSDATGEIYISGHDHQTNSMLYRLYQADNSLRWIGDARTASQEANNWQANETAQKFHTRPINLNGNVYVATLDSSDMNNSYLNTRGFHWYGYAISENRFIDLSATEPNGVGSPTLQLATIQKDPRNNLLYGMSIPENKLVRYDIAKAQTTVLGKPSAWTNFFYTNRFMWVDSRGRVYITGGSSRAQWNQGEPRAVFNHVWYYDPVSGFGELPNFALQGPNAMEVGQWDRTHANLYTSDDQGNIYRFNDASASWKFLGRPDFSASLKTWVFQLSADEKKIYIGLSDGSRPNAIYEYDIATGSSYELAKISDLDDVAANENFITGYDSWDSRGNFHIASFSMYDGDNVYMIGINPVKLKVAKGILTELVEVTAAAQGATVTVSRNSAGSAALDVLYEVRGMDASGAWIATTYGSLNLPANQTSLTVNASSLQGPAGVASRLFVLIADGNQYVIDETATAGISIPN